MCRSLATAIINSNRFTVEGLLIAAMRRKESSGLPLTQHEYVYLMYFGIERTLPGSKLMYAGSPNGSEQTGCLGI